MKSRKLIRHVRPATTGADYSLRPTPHAPRPTPLVPPPSSLITHHSSLIGFTILEMLVATGVLAVMVSILFGLFAQGSNAWRYGERQADVYQASRLALDFVARDVAAAMIDTTTNLIIGQSPAPMRGLSVIIRSSPSGGNPPSAEASKYGHYDDLHFVAPTTIGNGPTNNDYRVVCGVRYYVAQARKPNGGRSDLGNLTRVIYRTTSKNPSPYSIYETEWWTGGTPLGTHTNTAVLAENVLTFRVQPLELDPSQGLKLANPTMFRNISGDRDFEFGGVRPGQPDTWQWFQSWPGGYGNNNRYRLRYPALIIGLCVVDRRLADRINQMGLDEAASARGFQTVTNWTTANFECCYK